MTTRCFCLALLIGLPLGNILHSAELPLSVEGNDSLPPLEQWHYRTAIPFPAGVLQTNTPLELCDGKGKPIPCEFNVLATWHPSEEGKEAPPELIKRTGIRWLGLDFTAPTHPRGVSFKLRSGDLGKDWKPVPSQHALKVTDTNDLITVDNGLIKFTVKKKGYNFIDSLFAEGKEIIKSGSGQGAYATKEDGTICWSANDPEAKVIIEQKGPMLTVIRAEGWHKENAEGRMQNAEGKSVEGKAQSGKGFCKFVVRIYAYADVPYLKVQHTWINTEDSDKTRFGAFGLYIPPAGASEGKGQGLNPPKGESLAFLVKDWESFEFLRVRGETVERMPAGGEASGGYFVRAGVGIAIRDFVQNYPKEVEFTPDGTWLHFWPKHAEEKERAPAMDNLWRLWFCHEGRLLSFKLPESYHAPEFRDSIAMPHQGNGYQANAMGLAKTHELILVFGEAVKALPAFYAAFQEAPGITAGGEWNCNSKVFGELASAPARDFPDVEEYFAYGHDTYVAWRARVHDWGMWSFGDTHSVYGPDGPAYYRLMQSWHYSPPVSAWLLHWRSGKQTYLTQARRNGLHIMDVDLCHYVAPDYRSTDNYFNGKAVGGKCDYKGFVHWHAGARGGYNSAVDFLWWDYYVNGNQRALDAAKIHGDYMLRRGFVTDERGGDAYLNTMLDMFMATWESAFWEKVRNVIAGKTGTWNWRPYWKTYLSLCDDPIVQNHVIRWADKGVNIGAGGDSSDIVAAAYQLTGHPRYLTWLQEFFKKFSHNYYSPPRSDEWYMNQGGAGGGEGMVGYRLNWLFDTKRFPYAMKIYQDAAVKPKFDIDLLGGGGASGGYKFQAGHLLMIVDNPDGKPMDIAGWGDGAPCYSVMDPEGKILVFRDERVQKGWVHDGAGGAIHVPAPDGRKGLYAVYFSSPGGVSFAPKPPVRVAFVPEEGVVFSPGNQVHVMVPKGTARFTIAYRANWNDGLRSTFNLVDPSGNTRHSDDLTPGKTGRVEIVPAPEETGRTWLLAGRRYELVAIEGIPNCITPGPERMVPLERFDDYLLRLREVVLPAIRAREKEYHAKVLEQDMAVLNDPKMNGVMEVVHYESRDTSHIRYGVTPPLPGLQTTDNSGFYLEWRTLPVDAEDLKKDSCAFYWIGYMTPNSPPSPKPNFGLNINGTNVLDFAVGAGDKAWTGVNGVELAFEQRMVVSGLAAGTFRLKVPAGLLRAGEPLTLKVQSKAGRSGVYFGIYEKCIRKPKE